jgi:DNA-binding NtrC family response regulator
MPNLILIVDDEPLNLDLLDQELAELGHVTERALDGSEALLKLDTANPDLVLLDYQMPGMNGLEVLREIRRRNQNLPVIIITAYGTIERAVEAVKAELTTSLPNPSIPSISFWWSKSVGTSAAPIRRNFRPRLSGRYRLVAGKNAFMVQTVDETKKAAGSKSTVLLLGESGTGKEICARAIHDWSDRRLRPFIAINCVGLAKELLESELFGHEKGAFTGAHQLKKGKMELADGGTVFLDEIGDIAPELQTKLLRFLQEREFERVGGTEPITVDVRIIAATNRDLDQSVKNRTFREDLYHRLNVIAITLPPLRERKEDIPILANYFLQRFSSEAKKNFSEIAASTHEKLLAYRWPGNVRELANVIERAVVLGEGPILTVHHLPVRVIGGQPMNKIEELSYHDAINTYRRELIVGALATAQGNRAAAAKALGLHRTHLLKIMRALAIN